jgi:EpsI family protein
VTVATRTAIVSACLLATAVAVSAASRTGKVPVRAPLSELPRTLGEWSASNDFTLDEKVLAVLQPDDYVMRDYRRSSSDFAALYIGYHGSQRQGDSIHSPLNCLPGSGWIPTSLGRVVLSVPTAEGVTRSVEVNRVVVEKGMDREVVLYWYQSHGRVVASEYWGKFYTVVDAIRLARTDASLIRVVAPLRDGDAGEADRAVESFVHVLFPQLPRFLPS